MRRIGLPALLAVLAGSGLVGEQALQKDAALAPTRRAVAIRGPFSALSASSEPAKDAAPGVRHPLGDIVLGLADPKAPAREPAPLPGRILVKLDPSELEESFRPSARECAPGPFVDRGLLPGGVAVSRVDYVGVSPEGRGRLALTLERPLSQGLLAKAFSGARSRLVAAAGAAEKGGPTRRVLVDVAAGTLRGEWMGGCSPDYFYLKEKSVLREAFRGIGVVSMERVLRSAEVPDRSRPGFFRVRSFAHMLADAKRRHPRRAARAYPDLVVPANMENWFLLRLTPESALEHAVEVLGSRAAVQAVSADYPLRVTTNEDEYGDQWGLENDGLFQGTSGGAVGFDIDVETAWAAGPPQAPVRVAVIDTGFKEDLDDLENRLWTNTADPPGDEDGDGNADDDCNGYVDDVHGITTYGRWEIDYGASCAVSPGGPSVPHGVHGTHVAGVIAAEADNGPTAGIAGTAGTDPVELMNVAVGWCSPQAASGSGSAELAEGIWYATDKGADIANISLGARGMPLLLHEYVVAALDAGVVLVASAGNDGRRFSKSEGYLSFGVFPASLRGVIAVGGATRSARRWPGSNYGPGLDFVAPASEIRTLSFDTEDPGQTVADVVTVQGTSLSAAFTSGVAALVLGRYPEVTAPYMRQWLRATARDMTDPEGEGASLVGQDEWTGSGMLAAGTAVVSLGVAGDQPLDVALLVERLRLQAPQHFSDFAPDAVAGSPDLGIQVMGATCDPTLATQPATCPVESWRLEYGEGDFPSTWSPVAVPAAIGQRPQRTELSGSSYFRHTQVASGHNYLDTDLLSNDQAYTVRLVARNKTGREFTSEDWVIPIRAKIILPSHDTSVVGRWGWPSIRGFADIRPGASYTVSMAEAGGGPLWTVPPFEPANRYANVSADRFPYLASQAPDWGASASAFMTLMDESSFVPGFNAEFPDVDPAGMAEGWVDLRLDVQTAPGAVQSETVRLYLDNTHFDLRAGWPVPLWNVVPNETPIIRAADLGGSVGDRLFVNGKVLACFDPGGELLWQSNTFFDFAIGDVDGDGALEILTTSASISDPDGVHSWGPNRGRPSRAMPSSMDVFVHLWSGDSCQDATDLDGSSFSDDWPVMYNFTPTDEETWWSFTGHVGHMEIANLVGSSAGEVLFYRRPNRHYGIAVEDVRFGHLHALDSTGAEIWSLEFPPEQATLPFRVADFDGDGHDEVLLETSGQILEGDGTYRAGWEAAEAWDGGRFVRRDGTDRQHVALVRSGRCGQDHEVTLRRVNGDPRPGWPVTLPAVALGESSGGVPFVPRLFVEPAQLLGDGDDELVLCDSRLRVYGLGGSPVASFPETDLHGECGGVAAQNVDADPEVELLVLVHRYIGELPSDGRRGSFLEAYDLDGTRLAASDARWPIVVPVKQWFSSGPDRPRWDQQVGVWDVDGDGQAEVVLQHEQIEVLEIP
jgi:subtilisin family serine protease